MAPKKNTEQASKKRRVSAHTEESALLTSIAASESRDYDYIVSTIKEETDLASYIARLLRDGVLQKALATRAAPSLPSELGKKLPARCKKFRHLSPRQINMFFQRIETAGSFHITATDATPG